MNKNMMTHMQVIRLHEWLMKDPDNGKAQTSEELARQETLALGFPVPMSSVARLKRELGWSTRGGRRADDGSIKVLAHSVRQIMQELNIAVPPQLRELCQSRGTADGH